jgi:hypothetical protein
MKGGKNTIAPIKNGLVRNYRIRLTYADVINMGNGAHDTGL